MNSDILLPELRLVIRDYLGNLDLLELRHDEELLKRFDAYVLGLFNGHDARDFVTSLVISGAAVCGSFMVHFWLDEPCSKARDIDILQSMQHRFQTEEAYDDRIEAWCQSQSLGNACKKPYSYEQCLFELDHTTTYYLEHFQHRFQVTYCKESIKEAISKFDFMCTRSYFDGHIHVLPGCKRDLTCRELNVDPSFIQPRGFTNRLEKYMAKGFTRSLELDRMFYMTLV